MPKETGAEKIGRFQTALDRFVGRVSGDRSILAIVLVGSLSEETIWRRYALEVWIIEADGVSRRLRSDGEDERVFRILVEDGIDIHAEIIPRTRFKRMVEGSSRTAFSCNFFAERRLVHSIDASIDGWFETANKVAVKDQEKELLSFSTWTMHAHRVAQLRLDVKGDLELARQQVLEAAHSVAHTEIIRRGEICEDDVIYRAIERNSELFQTIYLDVLAKRNNRKVLEAALAAVDAYLDEHYEQHLKPLLAYLEKESRLLPLSEISDHFAFSQLHPWHLASACEWLHRKGRLEKLSAPFKLTKRSRESTEEPAYLLQS
jgi:hypothetical protein